MSSIRAPGVGSSALGLKYVGTQHYTRARTRAAAPNTMTPGCRTMVCIPGGPARLPLGVAEGVVLEECVGMVVLPTGHTFQQGIGEVGLGCLRPPQWRSAGVLH